MRASGHPVLTLRMAPLVGPTSPFWHRLGAGGSLPRGGRTLLRPVAEADVVESMHRALVGAARWTGWFEACGVETWSLAELAEFARRRAHTLRPATWEPPVEVLLAQRLPEPDPWLDHFGLAPGSLAAQAQSWS